MRHLRSGAGVVAVGQYIYVAGGMGAAGQLSSMERYDAERDVWVALSPMPTARSALTLAILAGHIYAMGGFVLSNHNLHCFSISINSQMYLRLM